MKHKNGWRPNLIPGRGNPEPAQSTHFLFPANQICQMEVCESVLVPPRVLTNRRKAFGEKHVVGHSDGRLPFELKIQKN